MVIDTSTRRNLELVETLREKQKRGTLLWVLDKTKTAMGARLLRTYIEQPLIHKEEIVKRQTAVEELLSLIHIFFISSIFYRTAPSCCQSRTR